MKRKAESPASGSKLLIVGVMTGPLAAMVNHGMGGWIDMYAENRLTGSTTARTTAETSRNPPML
jgi:hypothetical protein